MSWSMRLVVAVKAGQRKPLRSAPTLEHPNALSLGAIEAMDIYTQKDSSGSDAYSGEVDHPFRAKVITAQS